MCCLDQNNLFNSLNFPPCRVRDLGLRGDSTKYYMSLRPWKRCLFSMQEIKCDNAVSQVDRKKCIFYPIWDIFILIKLVEHQYNLNCYQRNTKMHKVWKLIVTDISLLSFVWTMKPLNAFLSNKDNWLYRILNILDCCSNLWQNWCVWHVGQMGHHWYNIWIHALFVSLCFHRFRICCSQILSLHNQVEFYEQ